MKLNCTKCGEHVEIPDMQKPQIMNTPGASLILLEHPKPGFCLNCKSSVAVQLVGANLHLQAAPVTSTPPQPMILSPNTSLVPGRG